MPNPSKLPRAWILGPILLVVGVALVSLRSCVGQHQAAAHVQQADQYHEAAVAATAQGAVHDQAVEDRKPQLAANASEVARLRAEVARLRTAAARPDAEAPAGDAAPGHVPAAVDLAPLVAKQDELIQAQDRQIQGLQAQVLDLTHARDSWRFSAQASVADSVQLRAALAAKEGLIAAAERRGFAKGLLAGGAAGALGGGYAVWRIR